MAPVYLFDAKLALDEDAAYCPVRAALALPGQKWVPRITYELWATKGDKTLAVGTFLPRDDGTASLLVKFPTDAEGPVSNLWVTLEQQTSGTRARPSNEVVLFRSPDQQAQR